MFLGESLQFDRRSQPRRKIGAAGAAGAAPAGSAPAPRGRGAGSERLDLAGIVARHQTPLLRYVGNVMPRAEDAQDVVQETFLRYCRYVRKNGESSVTDLSSWLFRVAHNLAQDILRRRGRERKAREEVGRRPAGRPEVEAIDGVIRRAAYERALAEMRRLPESHRHVLLLKIVQDMTLREIGRVTGLSLGNVAYRLNQGLKELTRRLKDAGVI